MPLCFSSNLSLPLFLVLERIRQVFIKEIRQQALIALHEASAVLFVTDGMAGVNPLDDQIAVFLRKECKAPVFVCVNKCESDIGEVSIVQILGRK